MSAAVVKPSIPGAILGGSAIIGAFILWASCVVTSDNRCAGFLASSDGSSAVSALAVARVNGQTISRERALQYHSTALKMAGCRLNDS